jgi:hypothetical protein
MKRILAAADKVIMSYRRDLEGGRLRPRGGEKWERTVEKQMVEIAVIEMRQLSERKSLEELCDLVDEAEEFAKKSKLVDV